MDFAHKITEPDHLKMTPIDAMYNIKYCWVWLWLEITSQLLWVTLNIITTQIAVEMA